MLAARQNKDLNNEIKSMSYELSELSSNIQYQTNMADKEYGYLLQEQSRQDQLDQEQRGYAFDILKHNKQENKH
jgi:chromosome segregation and condensation protein ScpB